MQKQKQNKTKTAFRNRPHTLTQVFERSCFFRWISIWAYFNISVFLLNNCQRALPEVHAVLIFVDFDWMQSCVVLFNKNIKTLTLHAVSKKIKTFNTVISFSQHQWFTMHSWNSPHISFFSNLTFWFFFHWLTTNLNQLKVGSLFLFVPSIRTQNCVLSYLTKLSCTIRKKLRKILIFFSKPPDLKLRYQANK